MKILFTSTGPWGTGSFSFVLSLMHVLEEMGHEVKVFFPNTQTPSSEFDTYDNDPRFVMWKFPISNEKASLSSFPCMLPDIHPRSTNKATFKDLSDDAFALYFSSMKEHLLPLLDTWKPDVIDCQHIWAMQKVVHALGFPYVCTVHHSDIMAYEIDPRMQPIVREGAQHADHIFTYSTLDRDVVVTQYGASPKKVSMLPVGYDPKVFHPKNVDREHVLNCLGLSLPKEAVICLFIGILSHNKGIDLIAGAARMLSDNSPIHFILVGSGNLDGTDHPRIHKVGYKSHVEIVDIINISKVLLLPSRNEGFGLVCLEAMACGIPVIVTENIGAASYIVGKTIPQEDGKSLCAACTAFAKMPDEEYSALSKKALEKVKEFLWEKIAKKRLLVYQNCTRKSTRQRPVT